MSAVRLEIEAPGQYTLTKLIKTLPSLLHALTSMLSERFGAAPVDKLRSILPFRPLKRISESSFIDIPKNFFLGLGFR
jgi:hypothetical protein